MNLMDVSSKDPCLEPSKISVDAKLSTSTSPDGKKISPLARSSLSSQEPHKTTLTSSKNRSRSLSLGLELALNVKLFSLKKTEE
jgi:hypothetical protein